MEELFNSLRRTRLLCDGFRMSCFGSAFLALLLNLSLIVATCRAGLCGSEVVVVVNATSLNSRTLANHYIALRNIPPANVVVLEGVPNSEVIKLAEFQEKILKPLLETINERKLASNVKCIAYSADFPTAIDIGDELKPLGKLPKYFTGKASINALTFLYQLSLGKSPDFIQLDINFYARRELDHYFTSPAGAASADKWAEIQQLIGDKEHAKAVDALEELLETYPHQFPVAYLAAAQAALADDSERALKLLKTAIEKGWTAGGYLKNDDRFESLRSDGEFQVLQLLLDENIVSMQPSIAFQPLYGWSPNGVPSPKQTGGVQYLLSTVLGVTRGLGTTLPEAVASLERAASADFTHPQGAFYFSDTKDVRTTTRRDGFAGAVERLEQMGFEAEIISDGLPRKKPAVLGAQFGSARFDWNRFGSTLVPGAIADNLTSFGGIMNNNTNQTKLTELIKAGAAGSSGTVVEPYSMQAKFPTPELYVHYAAGASLAEAFYQSVTGPYQLLIVGDPACRPFSHAPQPIVDKSPRNLRASSTFTVEIKDEGIPFADWLESDSPRATRTQPIAAKSIGIVLDGRLIENVPATERLTIRTNSFSPGYHEVCLKFTADDPLAQSSDATLPVWKGNGKYVQLNLPSELKPSSTGEAPAAAINPATPSNMAMPEVSLKSEMLVLNVTTDTEDTQEIKEIRLQHDFEVLERAEGKTAEFTLAPSRLGMGPIRLQAVIELTDGTVINSVPRWIRVIP